MLPSFVSIQSLSSETYAINKKYTSKPVKIVERRNGFLSDGDGQVHCISLRKKRLSLKNGFASRLLLN